MALNTKIRGNQINDSFFGAGLQRNGEDSDIMEVKVDDSTIEVATDTVQVKDDGITNSKLANMTRGTVKVGGESDAPTDLNAKTDGYILIGDGTDVNSVAVSGDITITNAGVTSIGATKVTDSMLNDDVASGLAGDGLSASSGVMALDLNELTGAVVAVSADSIAFIDADDNSTKKESIADLVTAMAGSGLTATNGVLSVDAISNNVVEGDIEKEDESANCDGEETEFTLSNTPIANSLQVFLNGLLQQEGSGKDYTVSGTTVTFATAPETGDILVIHYITNN